MLLLLDTIICRTHLISAKYYFPIYTIKGKICFVKFGSVQWNFYEFGVAQGNGLIQENTSFFLNTKDSVFIVADLSIIVLFLFYFCSRSMDS